MDIERERLKEQLIRELDIISDHKLKSISKTRNSFIKWCRETIYSIARVLGETISAPIKAIDDFFKGLWRGLFG